jgi:hypothetical protein
VVFKKSKKLLGISTLITHFIGIYWERDGQSADIKTNKVSSSKKPFSAKSGIEANKPNRNSK